MKLNALKVENFAKALIDKGSSAVDIRKYPDEKIQLVSHF